jgi:hypothetical protein
MAYQIFLFLIVDPISLHMQSVHLIMHLWANPSLPPKHIHHVMKETI